MISQSGSNSRRTCFECATIDREASQSHMGSDKVIDDTEPGETMIKGGATPRKRPELVEGFTMKCGDELSETEVNSFHIGRVDAPR